ncbi:MAG: hypothetical protein AAF230_08795 [Pseudomonadota bacterium]
MTRTVFGPAPPSARFLSVALIGFAGMWVYFAFCIGQCDLVRVNRYFLLFAAVVFVLAGLAWNWRPFRAQLVVATEGITVECQGMAFVPKRTIAWDQIAGFGWVPGGAYGSTAFFRVESRPEEGLSKGRTYDLPAQGLGTLPPIILEAAEPHLAAAGFRLEGALKRPMFTATHVAVVPVEAPLA